jgi:PAS domain S-box-containing protein
VFPGVEALIEIIDFHAIQDLMDAFYKVTKIGVAILDLEGNIRVATGWQDVCTKFHRVHPEALRNCVESDLFFSRHVEQGKYILYKCKNNMWDMATPIIAGNKHIANLFLGQFFFDDEVPVYEVFVDQAKKYGFDLGEYLAALERVPRWSRETVRNVMEFYTKFADLVSKLNYANIKLAGLLSEQKRIEEDLRESEERHRQISDLIADYAYSCVKPAGGEFAIDWVAGAVEKITGYSIEEIRRHECWKFLVNPCDMPVFEKHVTGLRPGERSNCELRIVRKDGSNRWIRVLSRALEDRSDPFSHRLFGSCEDITERKEADEVLKQTEEKYRSIFENAVEGIFQATPEGKYLSVNPAYSKMCGFQSPEEMVATITDIATQLYVNPVDRKKIKTLYEGVGVVKNFETEFKRVDGRRIWVSINARAVRDEHGKMLFYEGTIEDITARKQAEDERRRLEERLRRAEKMEALGTLAGGVAHDLNNVLGIIVGYSELLLDDLDAAGSARAKTMAILKGGQRAAAIVQDLLTLARRGVPGRKVLNLNNVVVECRNSLEFSKVLSEHPNIEIKMDLEADLLNLSGSSVHLEKSFTNLVFNAAEAMPNGGILTVKTANRYLDKPISGYDELREGDYVVLTVSDTGEGIPLSDLKRIFEPFYTKKVMGRSGTGLGLAVVWGTVKDHLGYINVESEEGTGTVFTLYFPVTREELTPEHVSLSASAYMGKGEFILVVDDVKEQRELAGAMLKKLNYTVETVSSGEEAVAYLKNHAVDLVVLDMIMDPGMDGLDTYRKMIELHPHQKAIIVSGFAETERVSKAQCLGAGAYVKKPYVLEKLGMAVRKELDRPPSPLA